MTNRVKFLLFTLLLCFLLLPYKLVHSAGGLPKSLSNSNAEVFIISPLNKEVVSSPVKIIFGVTSMDVAPAGIKKELSGHHHLMIDTDILPNLSRPIPSDEKHLHFGKGQTSTFIDLKSGTHTLQLIFGDYAHIPHDKPLISKKITITVE
jgi:hypothetical protein|tara:strand:+ start:1815 stop:2264 length:450 start_codon:yes stop_codon:yes gene_type:complete